ncbi:MAG: hypothetical protein AAGC55_18590, partial [Myxococcota bacterium]
VPVEFADSGELYNDIKLAEGDDGRMYALLASNINGVVVIDVSDPDAPLPVTSFPARDDGSAAPPEVHTLFVANRRAYITHNRDDSLRIYDLADPRAPVLLGSFTHPDIAQGGYLHDLYVSGDRAYLNYWNLGMAIVDVSDPGAPAMIAAYQDYGGATSHSNWVTRTGGRTISVHGDEGYNAHVRIVDVAEDSADLATTIGSFQTRPQVSVHNILAHDNLAFVTYYQDGLRVLDLSEPTAPREIAHMYSWPGTGDARGRNFFEGAIGVDFDPATGMVYLADTHRGLIVLSAQVLLAGRARSGVPSYP